MLKEASHKTISVLMALLVLFSTSSFAVDKHFCGELLVDMGIFSEAESCGMGAFHNDSLQENHSTEDHATDCEKSCCKQEKEAIEGQNELHVSFDELDFQQQVFLTSFFFTTPGLIADDLKETFAFRNYSPPLLVSDIQLLDQVFLI